MPDHGLLVVNVTRGSPADKAGLQAGGQVVRLGNLILPVDGDVIVALNDKPVNSYRDYTVYLEMNTRPGDQIQVTFLRKGGEEMVTITLGERPQQ